MTSIIELARQAGLELNWFDDNFPVLHGKLINLEQLIRADERELCALPELLEELENCLDLLNTCFPDAPVNSCIGVAITKASAAIRARGKS